GREGRLLDQADSGARAAQGASSDPWRGRASPLEGVHRSPNHSVRLRPPTITESSTDRAVCGTTGANGLLTVVTLFATSLPLDRCSHFRRSGITCPRDRRCARKSGMLKRSPTPRRRCPFPECPSHT